MRTVIHTTHRSLWSRLKARLHVAYCRWLIDIYEGDDAAIDREFRHLTPRDFHHALTLSNEQQALRRRLAVLRVELAIAEQEL